MKRHIRPGISIFLIILLSGCSTYQLSSHKKAVTVDQVSPNILMVNFCGNAYMSQKDVERYAMQRASEAVLSKGYSHFIVLNKRNDSKTCTLTLNKTPDAASLEEQSVSPDHDLSQFSKPNVTLTIQCFSAKDKIPQDAFNADQYLRDNFPGLNIRR